MNDATSEHKWFTEQIGGYFAGALDDAERARFEAHAAECESCKAEFEASRQMEAQMTAALTAIAPAADFEDRVVQRLRMNLRHRRWVHPMVRRVAATVAAAVVVAGIGLVGQEYLKTGKWPDLARIEANLRAFGQTNLQYANENRGTYPRTRYASTQPGADDVTSALHLLLATQDITTGTVTAPSSNAEKWDFGGGANTAWNWSDFSGRSSAIHGLTYGYANPNPDTNASTTGFRLGDVNNHDEDSQKILYSDGHVEFQSNPFVGIQRDNVYARKPNAVSNGDQDFAPPRDSNDSVLLPTDGDSDGKDTKAIHRYFDVSGLAKGLEAKPASTPQQPVAAPVAGSKIQAGDRPSVSPPQLGTVVALGDTTSTERANPIDRGEAQQTATNDGAAAAATQPVPGNNAGGVVAPAPVIRKVIREGVVEYEVDSFDSAFNTITKLTAEEGGFIAAADSDRLDNGKVRGVVTVRVPPDRLDVLLLKLRGLGDLKSQRLGSKDVSKQYTDLESELRACRAMEERLLEMIKTSKGKVAELLEAEKELGNQRTKIEKIQGELNYYNNLVSMATLTITASERDIRTPASASQTEEINTGLETNDVEHARTEIIKSIDEVKGRIIESELKQLEAGQLAARVVADVAPEHAGALVDRLRQLGKVARLDIQRKQTETKAPGGAPIPPQKIEQAPTRLIISMYNLANVAPRLTTNLTLGAEDVEATYRGILKRVRDADGRVLSSNLNRQDAMQVSGNVQFEVKSVDADAVLNDIRTGPGAAALTVNVTENPDTANVTTAKQAFTVQIVAAGRVAPREVRVLAVQTSDVEGAMQKVIAAAQNSRGRVTESSISQDANGKQMARVAIEVPLGAVDQMVDFARQQGKVRTAEASKNSQVPDGPLARARIMLSIGSGETIVPAESGFWASIRDGLSTSVRGLLWSLQLIVIGLCLIGPWVLIGWGGLRFWKRRRAQVSAS